MRISNETHDSDPRGLGARRHPSVYWQVAGWLVREGYATTGKDLVGGEVLRLTDRGRRLAEGLS